MWQKIKNDFYEFKLLMRSVPTTALSLFVISVFAMNLLANKSISLPTEYLALDCGILVSWFAFLVMDLLTKHFGPKAATQISVLATVINLVLCLVFFIASCIDGVWGESFVEGSQDAINTALNNTFGGTWYIIFGSTVAFLLSAVVNNFTNWAIGKAFGKNPDSLAAFTTRTYLSTAIGQFADNMIFALIVSHRFFGWTLVQCVSCALTGMAVELLCEIVFSFVGYYVCKKWKQEGIGHDYLDYIKMKENL